MNNGIQILEEGVTYKKLPTKRQQADALYVKRVFDAMQQTELEVADLLCDYYNLLCVSLINSRYPNAEEWLKEMEEKVSA
jgi:hypothetical protein